MCARVARGVYVTGHFLRVGQTCFANPLSWTDTPGCGHHVPDREGLKCTPRLFTADALRVRTHKLECTRCLLRVLADFSVHGVKVPARNGQIW